MDVPLLLVVPALLLVPDAELPPVPVLVPDVLPVAAPVAGVLATLAPAEPLVPDAPLVVLLGSLPNVTMPVVTTWLIGGCGTTPLLISAGVTAVAAGVAPAPVLVPVLEAGVATAKPLEAPVAFVDANVRQGLVLAVPVVVPVLAVADVAGVPETAAPTLVGAAVATVPTVPAAAGAAVPLATVPAAPTVPEAAATVPLLAALVPLAATPGVLLEAEPPAVQAARSSGTATSEAARRFAEMRDNMQMLLVDHAAFSGAMS